MAQEKTGKANVPGILGAIAFFVGMVLTVVGGIFLQDSGTMVLVLVIFGIVVGIFNITGKEVTPFLIATIALIVVGRAGFSALDDVANGLGTALDSIVGYIATLMAPAAVISAIRAVWSLAKPG